MTPPKRENCDDGVDAILPFAAALGVGVVLVRLGQGVEFGI